MAITAVSNYSSNFIIEKLREVFCWKCHDRGKGKFACKFYSRDKIGLNSSARQLVNLCAFGLFVLTILRLFSPWKLVSIKIRSISDPSNSNTSSSSDACGPSAISAQDGSYAKLQEQSRQKDHIENNFGNLEEAFIKSIREPSNPPKRSRDDSIKLIYDIQSPSDWLDLIGGHDDHVCLFLFTPVSTSFLIRLDQGLMTLTKVTQRYIYEKQNPADCGHNSNSLAHFQRSICWQIENGGADF